MTFAVFFSTSGRGRTEAQGVMASAPGDPTVVSLLTPGTEGELRTVSSSRNSLTTISCITYWRSRRDTRRNQSIHRLERNLPLDLKWLVSVHVPDGKRHSVHLPMSHCIARTVAIV